MSPPTKIGNTCRCDPPMGLFSKPRTLWPGRQGSGQRPCSDGHGIRRGVIGRCAAHVFLVGVTSHDRDRCSPVAVRILFYQRQLNPSRSPWIDRLHLGHTSLRAKTTTDRSAVQIVTLHYAPHFLVRAEQFATRGRQPWETPEYRPCSAHESNAESLLTIIPANPVIGHRDHRLRRLRAGRTGRTQGRELQLEGAVLPFLEAACPCRLHFRGLERSQGKLRRQLQSSTQIRCWRRLGTDGYEK